MASGTYLAYLSLIAATTAALACLLRRPQQRLAAGVILLTLAATTAAFLWSASEPRYLLSDFYKGYYFAGSVVRQAPETLYDEAPPSPIPGVPSFVQYVNIPIVAYAFVPFAALSPSVAGGAITALGLVSVAVAFGVLVSLARLSSRGALVLGALFVANGPLYNSLREGNGTHFVLGAIALCLHWTRQGRFVAAGVVLALCAVLKPPLAILGAAFLVARQWRSVVAFALTGLGVSAASVLLFGWDLHVTWYERIVVPLQGHPLGAFNVQSTDGFVARLLEGGAYLTRWSPIPDISPAFLPSRLALLSLLWVSVLATRWRLRHADVNAMSAFDVSILLVVSILGGPVSWSHYYALMLVPCAFLIGEASVARTRSGWTRTLEVAGVLLVSLPVLGPAQATPGDVVARILFSHYFIGGVLILVALLVTQVRLVHDASRDTRHPSTMRSVMHTDSMRGHGSAA